MLTALIESSVKYSEDPNGEGTRAATKVGVIDVRKFVSWKNHMNPSNLVLHFKILTALLK